MTILDINNQTPKEGECYFLDCNVLMYMHYTNGGYQTSVIRDYSVFVTKILGAHAKLLMNDVLLSEFINTYIRAEFRRVAALKGWRKTPYVFKHQFKVSPEYVNTLQELKCIITRQIVPVFTFVDSQFSALPADVSSLFQNPNTFDFNDRYYGWEAVKSSTYIVSHDADFSDVAGGTLITSNSNLLPST